MQTKKNGYIWYDVNRDLLAIQDYAMFNTALEDDNILALIIHQWNAQYIHWILYRIAMYAGIEFLKNQRALFQHRWTCELTAYYQSLSENTPHQQHA